MAIALPQDLRKPILKSEETELTPREIVAELDK